MYEKHGLIPLSVIRNEIGSGLDKAGAERISALIAEGSTDADSLRSASRTVEDWESGAQYAPKSDSPRKAKPPKEPKVADPENPTAAEREALTKYALDLEKWKKRRGPRSEPGGRKFVRVPWKPTKDDIANALENHKSAVFEEASSARAAERQSAAADYVAPSVVSATGSAEDAGKVVKALEEGGARPRQGVRCPGWRVPRRG